MSPAPIIFKTKHRIRFSDLDPYNHMSTAHYGTYYVDHRMEGLRDNIGWDAKALDALPFMVWVRQGLARRRRGAVLREGGELTESSVR